MSDLVIDCISDTHGRHKDISLPGGDILIHAGDCSEFGGYVETIDFADWFKSQPYKHHILIPGNHDGIFEEWPIIMREELSDKGICVLNDSGTEIEGIKIWGSAITPAFCGWHFNRQRGPEIKRHWDMIPNDIDILITHGPPIDILDKAKEGSHRPGCSDLLKAIQDRPSIKLHIFGHLHLQGMSSIEKDGKIFVNCAYLDESYNPRQKTHMRLTKDDQCHHHQTKNGKDFIEK